MTTHTNLKILPTLPTTLGHPQPEKKKASAELEDQLLGVAGLESELMYELGAILQKNSDEASKQTTLSLKAYTTTMEASAESQYQSALDEADKLHNNAIQSYVSGSISLAQGAVAAGATYKMGTSGTEMSHLDELQKELNAKEEALRLDPKPAVAVGQQAPAPVLTSSEQAALAKLQSGNFTDPSAKGAVQHLADLNEVAAVKKQLITEREAASARQNQSVQLITGVREGLNRMGDLGNGATQGYINEKNSGLEKDRGQAQQAAALEQAASGVMDKATQSNSSNATQTQQQRMTMLQQISQAIRDSSHV